MVVLGIVRNNNHASTASRTDLPKVFKKRMECHGVESLFLSLGNHFPIAQPNSSKVTHAPTCRMVQQHRVFLLRGHPHHTARSILLEVDFIGRPQIYSWIGHESSEFFYMPPELQDRLGQLEGAVYADENQRI